MDQHIARNPNEARQSTKEGVVRYVLGISLVVVVIALFVAYKIYF
jgi:hypothetical protein